PRRASAVGGLGRDPQLPVRPTLAESGFREFEVIQWVGLLTTAGTPRVIVERLKAEVTRPIREPDMIAKHAALGVAPAGGSPEEFQKLIATEIRNWTAVARAANIKAE